MVLPPPCSWGLCAGLSCAPRLFLIFLYLSVRPPGSPGDSLCLWASACAFLHLLAHPWVFLRPPRCVWSYVSLCLCPAVSLSLRCCACVSVGLRLLPCLSRVLSRSPCLLLGLRQRSWAALGVSRCWSHFVLVSVRLRRCLSVSARLSAPLWVIPSLRESPWCSVRGRPPPCSPRVLPGCTRSPFRSL